VQPIAALVQRFLALPLVIRVVVIGAIAVAVLVSILAGALAHSSPAQLFATALHPEQLSEVEEQLAAWNVPFTPVADNVDVEPGKRNELLLRLSLAGIPHAHVQTSDDALANVGVLTPQSVIDEQTRSGLAGDIDVALRSVDGVDDARVIVAPAQSGSFADESARPATASVRLRFHPGAALSPESVAGIRRFVAASVPGLDSANVTILDDRGVALGDTLAGDDTPGLERSLQSALDAAFGSGVAIARVHAEYTNAESEERDTRRETLAGDPIVRSTQSETYTGGGKSYANSNEHDERGSDTREHVVRAQPGAVTRISTAVLIDAARSVDLVAVRELAAAIVGYDARRGDMLSVAVVPFHRALVPRASVPMLVYGAIAPSLPVLCLLVAIGLALRALTPPLHALLAKAVEHEAIARRSRTVAGYAPATVRSALAGEPPHAAAAIISALPTATAAAVLELYPPHEREAIVKRMQRAHAGVVPTVDEVLGRHE
jgi:flagellar M-ring protein FliF